MSPDLVAHVKQAEGLRLRAYRCPAGYWTVGYGHRVPSSKTTVTAGQAEVWLVEDLRKAEQQALGLVPGLAGRRLDALTDLVFNVGLGALDGDDPDSPLDDAGVVRALRAGDWLAAATRFRQWCHARVGGQLVVLPGLAARRAVGARWIEEG